METGCGDEKRLGCTGESERGVGVCMCVRMCVCTGGRERESVTEKEL